MFLCQCWICARSLCCVPLLSVKSRPSVLFVAACQVITDDYRLQIIEVTMTQRMPRLLQSRTWGPRPTGYVTFSSIVYQRGTSPETDSQMPFAAAVSTALIEKDQFFINIFRQIEKYHLSVSQIQADAANPDLRVHCKSINGFQPTFLPRRG